MDPLCLDAEMSAIGLDEISLCVFRAVRNALCFVNLASYLLSQIVKCLRTAFAKLRILFDSLLAEYVEQPHPFEVCLLDFYFLAA